MAARRFDGVQPAWQDEDCDEMEPASKMCVLPQRCQIVPVGFSDADLEASYVQAQAIWIKRWTIAWCFISLPVICVQAFVFRLNPMRSRAEMLGLVARVVICAQALVSFRLRRWNTEVASLMLFMVCIACSPMLSHQRACWAVGEDVEQLWPQREDAPQSDTIFILSMLSFVITFLALVPVRITRGWVIPAITPVVYFCWTLWLPQPGLEGGFVNRLGVGFALALVCLLLLLGRAQVEFLCRSNFERRHIAEKLMIKEKVRSCNVEFRYSPKPGNPEEDCAAQTGTACPISSIKLGSPETTLPNYVKGSYGSGDGSLFDSLSSSSGTNHDADAFESSSSALMRVDETSTLESKIKDLELLLLVSRYMAEVGGKALTQICNFELHETNKRHWARTRAVIKSMEQTRPNVSRRSRSVTLSSSQMGCCMSEVEAVSDEDKEGLQGHANSSSSHSPLPKCKNNLSPFLRPENAAASGLKLQEFDAFDGTWELENPSEDISQWLHRLVITGTNVIDGDGLRTQLKQSPDNGMFLEGGAVFVADGFLFRKGKHTNSIYKFKRV